MSAPAMPLTLHLGAHKTATSHLQMALRMATANLRDAGMFYAGPERLRETTLPLTRTLYGTGNVPALRRRARRRMDNVFDLFPEVLLSDENFLGGTRRDKLFGRSGRVYPDAEKRLAELMSMLRHRPATAVLSVRDPADFNVSAFALQLTFGLEIDLAGYLDGRDPCALDWTDLASRILQAKGIERLIVWRYEDYQRLYPRILRRLLPFPALPHVGNPAPANVSLSQPGYEWFVEQAMDNADIDLRVLSRRARERFPRADGHPGLRLLSDQDRARSRELYAQDVARLRALPEVEFLDPDQD